jgi:hypothetical protein
MVSNTLKMDLEELVKIAASLRRKYGQDAEYRQLRKELPDDWPI